MLAIELMAFSSKGDPVTRPVEIIDDIREFSDISLVFFAIIVIILSLTLGGTYMLNARRHLTIRDKICKYFRRSCMAFWNILETALDQENYQPKRRIRRIIWFFLVIGIFVVVVGYYANLMHTNMVSDVWPPTIDRISDFFTDRFKSVEIFMFKSLWCYDILHNSDPGSDLRLLYDKIRASKNCSIGDDRYCEFYKLVFGNFLKMTKLANYLAKFIESGKGAIIAADLSMHLARWAICTFKPSMWRILHHTESLASGTQAFFSSIDGDRDLQRSVGILQKMAIIESGLIMKHATESSQNIFERLFQQSPGATYYQCTDNIPDDDTGEPVLKFGALRTFLILITICFIISALVLLDENLTACQDKTTVPKSGGSNKSKQKGDNLSQKRITPSPMVVESQPKN